MVWNGFGVAAVVTSNEYFKFKNGQKLDAQDDEGVEIAALVPPAMINRVKNTWIDTEIILQSSWRYEILYSGWANTVVSRNRV
jgi:hypothetical protein